MLKPNKPISRTGITRGLKDGQLSRRQIIRTLKDDWAVCLNSPSLERACKTAGGTLGTDEVTSLKDDGKKYSLNLVVKNQYCLPRFVPLSII